MSATWKLGLMMLVLLTWVAMAQVAPIEAAKTDGAVKAAATSERLGDPYYSTTKGPFYYHNEYQLRARKLMRGVANVILCPAEIPNQMFREAYQSSPVTGGIVGIWKGVCKGSKRLVIGAWEIVTFYYPANNHYQPFVEPEVVFMEYIN